MKRWRRVDGRVSSILRAALWVSLSAALIGLFAGVGAAAGAAPVGEAKAVEAYSSWVEKLASKEFEGRGIQTEGLVRARDYIVAHFKATGLPGAFGGELMQQFSVRGGARVVRQELAVVDGEGKDKVQAKDGADFTAFGFSAS